MPKVNAVLEPVQKTAEMIISSGDLHSLNLDYPLRPSELRDDSRTSKKSSVKPRLEHIVSNSRPLLRE
ncbi:MAG: hypothetical protein A3A96_01665 [Candidatus Zambryskibacteria bacterium RIFCSPLOWO2_01_FULL_39_39]|uniref:Uncharacterized protein n=1 Tax=Candidatus Zambryskibacteria bacterium RIFCSPLOWO2_01_FULL_39_39 TaxID=1802758 RepID=A0A1G2TXT5_9BACT|nr:MAG: hypothetical protein A3A96_01665 [Candidatus Zambryskibacteria bacterium RIFCSPLOWO2_01_FULL_39_39]